MKIGTDLPTNSTFTHPGCPGGLSEFQAKSFSWSALYI